MGNLFSICKRKIDLKNKCLICLKHIDKKDLVVKCVHCGILLHNDCEENDRKERKFTICPGCNKKGCLGIIHNNSF
jgi:hypothetical protein